MTCSGSPSWLAENPGAKPRGDAGLLKSSVVKEQQFGQISNLPYIDALEKSHENTEMKFKKNKTIQNISFCSTYIKLLCQITVSKCLFSVSVLITGGLVTNSYGWHSFMNQTLSSLAQNHRI